MGEYIDLKYWRPFLRAVFGFGIAVYTASFIEPANSWQWLVGVVLIAVGVYGWE